MCKFCRNKHVLKKEFCLAWGKTCKTCHGRKHFSVKSKKVNIVESKLYDESSDEELWFNVVNSLNEL